MRFKEDHECQIFRFLARCNNTNCYYVWLVSCIFNLLKGPLGSKFKNLERIYSKVSLQLRPCFLAALNTGIQYCHFLVCRNRQNWHKSLLFFKRFAGNHSSTVWYMWVFCLLDRRDNPICLLCFLSPYWWTRRLIPVFATANGSLSHFLPKTMVPLWKTQSCQEHFWSLGSLTPLCLHAPNGGAPEQTENS